MREKLLVKVPGKLMVAGEYAVLEPNQPLIVMAVNRYVYCSVEGVERGQLHLPDLGLERVDWDFVDGEVVLKSSDPRLNFVKSALKLSLGFLAEKGFDLASFSLSVRSELDDTSGKKYGLGSSAAVVTAVVSAVLQFFDKSTSKDTIFKIASMAHTVTQKSGSGADIAASTYGGVMKYKSFQAEWLLGKMSGIFSVRHLVESDWVYYSRKSLQFPHDTKVLVGWTGKPASTTNLVGEVKQLKGSNLIAYEKFLKSSYEAVQMIVKGMEENNSQIFYKGIKTNRRALMDLGVAANVLIETKKLHELAVIAEGFSGAGKLSGAGGGDCGLAFLPLLAEEVSLFEEWERAGISPLSLEICHQGARFV